MPVEGEQLSQSVGLGSAGRSFHKKLCPHGFGIVSSLSLGLGWIFPVLWLKVLSFWDSLEQLMPFMSLLDPLLDLSRFGVKCCTLGAPEPEEEEQQILVRIHWQQIHFKSSPRSGTAPPFLSQPLWLCGCHQSRVTDGTRDIPWCSGLCPERGNDTRAQ